MPKLAYDLIRPEQRTTSVVFASPHSGRDYGTSFLDQIALDAQEIRSSEDAFVDQLFDCAPKNGAPFLMAGAPRAFIDLNRSAEELDPALVESIQRAAHNPRVASGLGVIPRVVAGGRAIYRGKLDLQEVHKRLTGYWHPYHDALQALLDQSNTQFGEAILIDCHSMPHEAVKGVGPIGATGPDIVIGDRFGAAAAVAIVDQIEAAFVEAGFNVARNMPFSGAYVAQHYGRPSRRQHAVQIEIDRSLYMDELAVEPNANFEAFRRVISGVVADIAEIGRREQRLAAE